jgi:hypothetical protein
LGGGKEFLVNDEFASSETFTLAEEAITFSHIVSKMKDFSLQSGIIEICDSPVDKGTTGMGGMEDLEGIVLKEMQFSEIWGGTRIGMKVAGIYFGGWSLTPFDLWAGRLKVIPDPFTGVLLSSFLVVDPS